ncbi:MAG: alpha/beta hydrolase [Desulfobacca sp.]|nr:alpha/beta hydrolase [Desulfobacca sp.]
MKSGIAEKIMFPSGSLYLEGLLLQGRIPKGAVISHPHPLYGGDMNNHVVSLVAGIFQELGWTTLRFNFRGVGRSQGDFDQGEGEQKDVSASVAYLKELGIQEPIILAGYSFGAWVNGRAAQNNPEVGSSLLVSPPLAMMDFSFLEADSKTGLIIAGDQDPYCPLPDLRKLVEKMNIPPPLKIISGADHFFSYGSAELLSAIKETLTGKE